MSFTTFLMIFLLIVMVFIALSKIMSSSAFRIALITHEEKVRQKEIEEEIQKTKQRSIEEIKNPDLLMEVIEKMSRGGEIKIPLAAFDYIYRNMRKFTIIDKQGRLTIINQEDYLQFKKIAENLLRISEESEIDVKMIMDSIKKQEKECPIEFQEHEDGTIVEINHLERKFIIQKKNGEKHIVDYTNNTIVSENLVEQDEKKINPTKYYETKDALTEAEKKLKKAQQQLELEKHKNKKNKARSEATKITTKKDENVIVVEEKTEVVSDEKVSTVAKEKEEKFSTSFKEKSDELIIEEEEYFGMVDEAFSPPVIENSSTNSKEKSEPTTPEIKENTEPVQQKNISEKEYIAETEKKTGLNNLFYEFSSIEDFLEDYITFGNIEKFIKYILNDTLCITYNQHVDNTYINHKKPISDAFATYSSVFSNAFTTDIKKIDTLSTLNKYVINDETTDCILVNIHYFFIKILGLLQADSRHIFINTFYTDIENEVINTDVLTLFIEHINKKSMFAIGSKILMQQENHKNNIVNFRSVKFKDSEDKLWSGLFMLMFNHNEFARNIQKDILLFPMIKNKYSTENTKAKSTKLTLKMLLKEL